MLLSIAIPVILHGFYDTFLKKEINAGALVVAILSFGFLAGLGRYLTVRILAVPLSSHRARVA